MVRGFIVALLLLVSFGQLSSGADTRLLITKVVEDDNAMPGGQVYRLLAEDQTSVYSLSCTRKYGNNWPSVDKRLFKGLDKQHIPDDTACGPFIVGQSYPVFFHDEDKKHAHVAGRLVTFMQEDSSTHRVTRMVVFKVESVGGK
jgi:hypothetical protein